MFRPRGIIIIIIELACLQDATSHCHNSVCLLLLLCPKNQPDDDPVSSKHLAV